jgi:hypothetical protein
LRPKSCAVAPGVEFIDDNGGGVGEARAAAGNEEIQHGSLVPRGLAQSAAFPAKVSSNLVPKHWASCKRKLDAVGETQKK